MTVTAASFKTAKPQFADVDNTTVDAYLALAGLVVDDSWVASSRDPATIAYTCHLMTLDGLGTDQVSQSFASGVGQYQTIRSGEITLTRFRSSVPAGTDYQTWLGSTPCGQYYAMLLRMNKAGPRVAMGLGGCLPSGYAKDWPAPEYGWPGVFGGVL